MKRVCVHVGVAAREPEISTATQLPHILHMHDVIRIGHQRAINYIITPLSRHPSHLKILEAYFFTGKPAGLSH